MANWLKDIARWKIGSTLYLSVPFTWLLPQARQLALLHSGPVQAGGPAVQLMPEFLADVAAVNQPCPVEPLAIHNPFATFTSRGCPNACAFCAVPRLEGDLNELRDWRPAPIICDNNLLAASRKHFDRVIDRLKSMPGVDFNQGLEALAADPAPCPAAGRIEASQNPLRLRHSERRGGGGRRDQPLPGAWAEGFWRVCPDRLRRHAGGSPLSPGKSLGVEGRHQSHALSAA